MKDVIRKVLDKYSDAQLNLASDVAKEILANEIHQEILSYNENEGGGNQGDSSWLDENDKTSDCGGV